MESYLQSPPPIPFIFTLFFLLYCFCYYCWHQIYGKIHASMPINWPVIGMMPHLLGNLQHIHEYGTQVLIRSGGTFEFKGPWLCNFDMIVTSDPADIHYILSKNFSNYPKGPEFQKIFDIFGDGILNSDSELWETHRKVTLSIRHHPDFQKLVQTSVWEKVEKGLLPILEHCMNQGTQIDLQDVFHRFTFDIISRLVLDYDPNSLSLDFPTIPCERAFDHVNDALMQRHVLPETCWKLQKWLRVGKERKLREAWDAFDQFIYPCIQRKQRPRNSITKSSEEEGDHHFDGLTAFMEAYEAAMKNSSSCNRKFTNLFLRDAFLSLMIAGRDTTSTVLTWLFFLLSQNPSAEAKILQEIEANKLESQQQHNEKKQPVFNVGEYSQKLVYLHGALCETLRLFPPVALQHKSPVKDDILPSGVSIKANKKVLLFFYSMGRMESIWGKDCLEFKPERWITDGGKIRHEPSFKFPAFNAGPRTCLGKEIVFVQMKMVAASIIYNFHVHLVDAHLVSPSPSIVIQTKHGLKVMLSRRSCPNEDGICNY